MQINKLTILFLLIVLSFSCQKENSSVIKQSGPPENYTQQKSMFEAMYDKEYTNDFMITADKNNVYRELIPGNEEWELTMAPNTYDLEKLAASFPSSKAKIEEFFQKNETGEYTRTIQFASLKYLRRYVLLQNPNKKNQKMASELLEILIETEAVDLDIIVDAYVFSKRMLSNDQKREYYDYIVELHKKDMDYIQEKFPVYKKAIEENTGVDQKKYIMWAKGLERKSLACAHARKAFPQLQSSHN